MGRARYVFYWTHKILVEGCFYSVFLIIDLFFIFEHSDLKLLLQYWAVLMTICYTNNIISEPALSWKPPCYPCSPRGGERVEQDKY